MSDPESPDGPREATSGVEHATRAFELLGNETRLDILLALWEAYDPFDDDVPVPFSALQRRVGTADSGQFNYHLDQLTDHFVSSRSEGYEITAAGLKFVRSVIAGAGIEQPALPPTQVETTCKQCGSPITVSYDDGMVYVTCTECEGLWTDPERRSGATGHLAKFPLDPAGLTDRSPADIYAAAWVHGFQRLYSMIEGVCPTCTGPIEGSLALCPDHDTDGICSTCRRRAATIARFRCPVCKEGGQSTLGAVAKYHPAVVAFCNDHGVAVQYGANDLDHIDRRLEHSGSTVDRLSADPPRVRVTTEIDGDELPVTIDETLSVVAIGE